MLDLKLGETINMPMNGWLSIMAKTQETQTKLSYLFFCSSTNNNQQQIRRYYRAYNSNTAHVLEFLRKNTDYKLISQNSGVAQNIFSIAFYPCEGELEALNI